MCPALQGQKQDFAATSLGAPKTGCWSWKIVSGRAGRGWGWRPHTLFYGAREEEEEIGGGGGGRVVFSSAATDAGEGGVLQGAGGARGPRREPPNKHATGRTLCRQVSGTAGDGQPVPARCNAFSERSRSPLFKAHSSSRLTRAWESESVRRWVVWVGGRGRRAGNAKRHSRGWWEGDNIWGSLYRPRQKKQHSATRTGAPPHCVPPTPKVTLCAGFHTL